MAHSVYRRTLNRKEQMRHRVVFVAFLFYGLRRSNLVVSRDQQRCAEADRGLQKIWDTRKDCGSFVDEKLRALRRRNVKKQGMPRFRDIVGCLLRTMTPPLFRPNFWVIPLGVDCRCWGSKT